MKKLPLDKKTIQEFFIWLAFDKTTTLDDLQMKAENAEEIKLGEFISNYSHNNSDYYDNGLIVRIKKSFSNLNSEELMIFHNHCKSFCELFEEQEPQQFANQILDEINYFSERLFVN